MSNLAIIQILYTLVQPFKLRKHMVQMMQEAGGIALVWTLHGSLCRVALNSHIQPLPALERFRITNLAQPMLLTAECLASYEVGFAPTSLH
jgi:hypothetical protein